MRYWKASAVAARDTLSSAQRSTRSIALLSDTAAYTISFQFSAALNGTVSVSGCRHSTALQSNAVHKSGAVNRVPLHSADFR